MTRPIPDPAATKPGAAPKRVRLPHLAEMKSRGERIAMITACDTPTAQLADAAGADIVLVGDSLGNTVLGLETTLEVTLDMMVHHCRAARRGTRRALLLADMPFLAHRLGPDDALRHAGRLVQEGGAEAIKIEGADRITLEAIRAIVAAGIPVMGHIGLTPQAVHALGGYRVQGRGGDARQRLVEEARTLQQAGVFAVLVELAARGVAQAIREAIQVPLIGIGAGPECDGQVLVWHDLLGLRPDAPPRFCKPYADLWSLALDGLRQFRQEVKDGRFPQTEHEYE